MKIIIPLGGVGKRFSDEGYTMPKPLIMVGGKPILFWLIDSLNLEEDDSIYIPYNSYLSEYGFEERIHRQFPMMEFNFLQVGDTEGASDTVRLCLEHFDIKGSFLTMDGDCWYEDDILEKFRNVYTNKVTYFTTKNPKPIFSYVEVKNNVVVNIMEKVKISDKANSGCYFFSNALEFIEMYKLLSDDEEKYISKILGRLVQLNKIIQTEEVKKFHVLGTPEQIKEFEKLPWIK